MEDDFYNSVSLSQSEEITIQFKITKTKLRLFRISKYPFIKVVSRKVLLNV